MTTNHDDNRMSQNREVSEDQLEALFRRLNLAHMRRIYQEVADRAERENWSYRDFLALLLAEEVARRKQTRLQRLTRSAHFPFFKTIEEFDFSLQSTLRLSLVGSYLGPDLVSQGRSLILYGKTGRGKTHLAVVWFVKIKLRVVCQTLGVLRSSNSNYRGSQKSGSVRLTSRKCAQNPECQSRHANPRTIRQQQSAAPQDGLGGDCVAVMQAAYPRHGDHLAARPRCRRWNSACRRVLG